MGAGEVGSGGTDRSGLVRWTGEGTCVCLVKVLEEVVDGRGRRMVVFREGSNGRVNGRWCELSHFSLFFVKGRE